MKRFGLGCLLLWGVAGNAVFLVSAQEAPVEYKQIQFDSQLTNQLFPDWKEYAEDDEAILKGVIGKNPSDIETTDKRLFQYIPRITNLLLKFVAPMMVVLTIYAGVRFITAGGEEEEISKSRQFFLYAVIGLAFIVLSYSLMRVVYNLLATG